MTQKKYFGTDGIRGEVGKTVINAEFMLKLGWAAGKVFSKEGIATVLIGKDTRVSGYMLESALQAGFAAAGVDIFLLGPMPTPAIAYLTQSIRAHAGVVISASHNPYHDNGIKFFDCKGYKLADELEFEIESLIDSPMKTVASEYIGKATRMVDAAGRYIEFCKSTFPSHLSLRNLSIVVDCANGAAYSVAPKIFHELGAKVTAVSDKPDGFNINKSCGATDTLLLQKTVTRMAANIGIALDGDGDRVIMVDECGEVVNGDQLLCIIALNHSQMHQKPIGVAGTVMSNLGLEQALQAQGISFDRAQVGDRYVLEMLKQKGWCLGGESSGHIVDLNVTTTGDGIVTALQVLRVMQDTGKPLSLLKRAMTQRPQVLINVTTSHRIEMAKYPQIAAKIIEVEQRLQDQGRVLLRASGTEPLIRVMVEGNNEAEVQTAASEIADVVRSVVSVGSSAGRAQ
ncbi:MAG: phosphoglucosamine mutase [Coxiella sp. RIFCSPHIGHO2_12_FULL_42_15]|nr:MAG: phosphoglucosamine mutase [Coxiella sp. RIFCSPHIGHO2_12_FULL_42_15]